MLELSFMNLAINNATEITSIGKRNEICSCRIPQNNKGRTALKAFLLQDSIDSSQLKQELVTSESSSTNRRMKKISRSKTKAVRFNLSMNITEYLPTTHSRKGKWYSKSEYISFREDVRKHVRLASQNNHLDYQAHKLTTTGSPLIVLSSFKQALITIYARSLLKQGGPGFVTSSSSNGIVQTLREEVWEKSELTLRGLESYILSDIKAYRKYYRNCLVLHYNNELCGNGRRRCCNSVALRSKSIEMTKASIEFSHALACIHTVNAKKITSKSSSCIHLSENVL